MGYGLYGLGLWVRARVHNNGRLRVRAKATLTFSAACAVRVTIFSTGGEIPPCCDFYVVTHSYSSHRSYAHLVRVRAMD